MLRQEMDLGGATQDSHMRMPINLSYGAIHESSTKFKMHLGAAGVGAPVAVGASGGQAITKLQASSSAPGVPAAGGQMQTTAPTAPPPPAAAHLISHATHLNHEEECNVQGPMARSSIIINNNNSSSSCSQDGVSAPVAAEAFATSEPKSRKLAAVKYRECLKNHAANIGGHALDGCGEFMASGEEGSLEALMCAACGCHRNFHRREAEGEEADDQAACGFCTTTSSGKHLRGLVHDPRTRQLLAPAQLAALPPPLPPPPATAAASPLGALPPGNAAGRLPPHASHYQYNQQAQLQHPMVGLANSNPGGPPNISADCDDPMVMQQQLGHRHFQYPGHHAMQHVPAHTSPNANIVGPSPNYASYAPPHHPPPFDRHPYHNHHYSLLNSNSSHHHMMMKKRFRTKFTAEQKDRMLAFAEKLGWRIQKQDEAAVQQFCGDVGVRRHVLKVWMHNNKNTMGKKISPNEMPVGYLDSGSASPTNSGSGVH